MANFGTQTQLGQSGFDTPQRSPCAGGHRVAILIEEAPRRPGKSIVDHPKAVGVDAYPLVTDDADLIGEGDPGAVNREAVPGRTRAEPGIGERLGPVGRDHLGQREAGRIDHRPDEEPVPEGAGCGHRSVQARLGSVSVQA